MDLEPGWEKKALIVLGIITVIIVIYAFNPFAGTPNVQIQNQTPETPAVTPPPAVVTPNNTTANRTNVNITTNGTGTFQITAEQAKKIAAESGYITGEPIKGIYNVINVWIVPLMKNNKIVKNVYIDASNGNKVFIEVK
ncbi:MAG: peptidase [Methanobacterium sp.]|uniref:peptidase n=1 Tax=Methanobacterium sp. TaxID=2164 RepID=UPI003D657CF9|nr:peptidase [Methanobacterium sp.]